MARPFPSRRGAPRVTTERPDIAKTLSLLKPFQRAAVDHAFDRLYLAEDTDRSNRFLIADEVGLGKTMIARGIVARAIDHLWDSIDRIDIVYVCSNATIARQNLEKLAFAEMVPVDRITMLPINASALSKRKLNFIACTPGTSFNLKSSIGKAQERILLYHMMQAHWPIDGVASMNLLQGQVSNARKWRARIADFHNHHEIDSDLLAAFGVELEKSHDSSLSGRGDLESEWRKACEMFADRRRSNRDGNRIAQKSIIANLRLVLARTCIGALEPDLVILDEFQRFSSLLDGSDESEAAEIARHLFDWHDETAQARTLLLSATPYKMYTTASDTDGEDHYRDFLRTIAFLQDDADRTSTLKRALDNYQSSLQSFITSDAIASQVLLQESRRTVEFELRRVMSRSERTSTGGSRDGMIVEGSMNSSTLKPNDVRDFLVLQDLADGLEQPRIIDYWKSVPHFLSLADDYKIKRAFHDCYEKPRKLTTKLRESLLKSQGHFLRSEKLAKLCDLESPNGRLRSLVEDVLDGDLWKCLWLPPSMPEYELGGPFADVRPTTKRLVFSAWNVVPKAISTLLSYEVERRVFESDKSDVEYRHPPRNQGLKLRREGDEAITMQMLGLLYPSFTLAEIGDPDQYPAEKDGQRHLASILKQIEGRIQNLLQPVLQAHVSREKEDASWYWIAAMLLDRDKNEIADFAWWDESPTARWGGDGAEDQDDSSDNGALAAHFAVAKTHRNDLRLGQPPEDLASVMALQALASPAIAALRAICRVVPNAKTTDTNVRDAAGRIADAVRRLLCRPESGAVLRRYDSRPPSWRRALEYAADGGIGATLTEYFHLNLPFDRSSANAADLALRVESATGIRTAGLNAHAYDLRPDGQGLKRNDWRLRTHFALRYGGAKNEDDQSAVRTDQVRDAFNSPFWPFVLCSTSVGQEGLDFHHYCHAVVHWNLPTNPVDLEQREGRVNRYMGHAIRRNVAIVHGDDERSSPTNFDPWTGVFNRAAQSTSDHNHGGMKPYWIYIPDETHARFGETAYIERHVPALPCSRDVSVLESLKKSLTVYRMAFGQPRQEDLLDYLQREAGHARLVDAMKDALIDLRPQPSF